MTDLTNVAALLNNVAIPGNFEADMSDYPAPTEPVTLDQMFGAGSSYEFRDLFINYYDQEAKAWKSTAYGEVPFEVMADVLIAQESIDYYNKLLDEHNLDITIEREVQWRALLAERLMAHTEP